jgi:hypothetical protein
MKARSAAITLILLSTSASAALPLTGVNILLLGESHMAFNGQLITTLPEDLVQQGAKVFAFGACGASAGDWLKTKSVPCSAFRTDAGTVRTRPGDIATTQPINTLIDKYQPNLIVLVIGDTMASYKDKEIPKSWVWQGVSALTNEIKTRGTRCVWVGPAWGNNGGANTYQKNNARAQEFSTYLSSIVSPCIYVDSLTLSKEGAWKTIDGQHFDKAGYESWAKGITDALTSPAILSTLKH